MSAGLFLALSLSATTGIPSLPEGADAVQTFREACVGTGLDRTEFERLGRERRWRPVRMTQHSGEPGWNVAFRTDGALIMMMGEAELGEAGRGADVVCSVSVERASAALEDEVGALAASLNLEDKSPMSGVPTGVVPYRIWSRLGDQTISYAAADDGRAVISLSRQIVTIETAPVSPPGN